MKPGYLTTEFYVTILTNLLAILALVFHTKYNVDIPKVATAMAGLANFGYSLSRSHTKAAFLSNTVQTAVAAPVKETAIVPAIIAGSVNPEQFGA